MALRIDMSRARRTLSERQRLVEAIRDAPTHEQETDWLEWKAEVSLHEKVWQAEIARQILGFANRHPDRAASTCGGCGYLVLGCKPGNVVGVAHVDAARLDDSVSTYVGKDGPQWDPDYLEIDGKTVLVITVEPPRWGDRIFAFEKEFEEFKSGDVFTRRSGKTQRANAQEMRVLSQRASARGHRLMIDLDWWERPCDAIAIDVSEAAVEAWIANESHALLSSTDLGTRARPGTLGAAAIEARNERDRPGHERDVETYLTEARPLIREFWKRRAVEKELGKLDLAIVNLAEDNFEEVEVVMDFEGGVWSAFDVWDIEVMPFPAPKPWKSRQPRSSLLGDSVLRNALTPSLGYPGALAQQSRTPRGWSSNSDSTILKFAAVDVRPRLRHHIGPVDLMASATYAGQEVVGSWYATSKNASGMALGTLTVRVSESGA